MTTYIVTIGTISTHSGNTFSGRETKTVKASTARKAAAAALGTRAKLTTEHDIDAVYAVDRDFGPDGSGRSNIRAAKVEVAE